MKLKSFKMKLKAGCADEYKKRHDRIWPELKELLTDVGIREYSIWLDKETDILFAVQYLPDDYDEKALAENSVMRKWWSYMKDIMETNADSSPVAKDLEMMFYMD